MGDNVDEKVKEFFEVKAIRDQEKDLGGNRTLIELDQRAFGGESLVDTLQEILVCKEGLTFGSESQQVLFLGRRGLEILGTELLWDIGKGNVTGFGV